MKRLVCLFLFVVLLTASLAALADGLKPAFLGGSDWSVFDNDAFKPNGIKSETLPQDAKSRIQKAPVNLPTLYFDVEGGSCCLFCDLQGARNCECGFTGFWTEPFFPVDGDGEPYDVDGFGMRFIFDGFENCPHALCFCNDVSDEFIEDAIAFENAWIKTQFYEQYAEEDLVDDFWQQFLDMYDLPDDFGDD